MESKKPIATSVPRPTFDITNGEESSSDSGNGSDKEEAILIKPEKKSSTERKFRRISTNCVHPKVPCPTCKGKGKLSQGKCSSPRIPCEGYPNCRMLHFSLISPVSRMQEAKFEVSKMPLVILRCVLVCEMWLFLFEQMGYYEKILSVTGQVAP